MAAAPGGVFVRRSEFDDQLAIQALVGEDAASICKRFGLTDADSKRFGVEVTHMIETASLGITAVDEKGTVVGYAAFYDYAPFSKEVDQATWPTWLHAHFGHPEFGAANTAWLAFFVADSLCQAEVAESILRTAFTTLSEIDVILFALPEDVRPFAPIRDTFEALQCLKPDQTKVRVQACHRGLYLPELLVRKARVEDHDDLVPVFNAQSEVLTDRYGEFFIAELIERQDERNTALVAEVDGHAIGLLALSADIDVALLQQTFDLRPFDAEEDDVPTLVNAFCVSVFCMDESFESRSTDFLHAAFASFPDCEYAVITLPHTTPEFSLVSSFTQAEPLPSSSFGHILYVFHRDALGGARSLSVRAATVVDKKALMPLLDSFKLGDDSALAAFDAATGPLAEGATRGKTAYVAECLGQPVGLALLHDECDVAALQAQYSLEDFILFSEHPPASHALLHTFVVNPIFLRHSRWVFKEIFRQHKKSCLYLHLQPDAPIPTVLSEFVQSKPRRHIVQAPSMLTELDTQRAQLELPPRPRAEAEGSLYFLTRKLLSEPKIINNSRIVIVGASDAALSLLESLIAVPYLHFAYIYLVAPMAAQRLQTPRGHLADAKGPAPFFARTGGYTRQELSALGLGARVRIVNSSMVDIDRQAKAIVLPEGSILPYDQLIVAPEFGDQSLSALEEQAAKVRGAFSIFNEDGAHAALSFLSSNFDTDHGKAMVYGTSIDAYATLQALLSRGVKASSIVLVTPPPSAHDEEVFADPNVRSKVDGKLDALGIHKVDGMRLVGLEPDDEGFLASVMLETDGGAVVSQPCHLLVTAGAREVLKSTFDALNGNSLVYDGRLVVDTHFCTNDKAIYATGVVTKFSRRYRSKQSMSLVSGRECGTKLAAALLPVLDPLSASVMDDDAKVPAFEKPRIVGALLPGPLHYVSIAAPVPGGDTYAKIKAHHSFGRELVNDGGAESYCSVRLDKHGVIRAITYLGPDAVETANWACLIGLPESALNNLAPRFDEGIVPDLPAFLRENWATALYHDRFTEFLSALRMELDSDDAFKAAMDKLRESPEYDACKLSPVDLMNLLPEAKRNLVRTRLLDYVAGNQNHLDMYLVPASTIMKKMEEAKLR